MSHDGIARFIHPSHTPMDGDTIFAITINKNFLKNNSKKLYFSKDDLFIILGSRCSDCVARSCNRAVYEASNEILDKTQLEKNFQNLIF